MQRKRSGGLLTVIVVGMILGGLGSCGGAFGIVGQVFQGTMQDFSRQMAELSSPGNPELVERQLEMQARVESVTAEWRWPMIAYQVLNLLASAALLAGTILLLRWSATGPLVFAAAAIGSVLVDIAGTALTIVVQLETLPILREHMSGITGADPNMPAEAQQAMGAMAEASMNVGICFGVAWALLKLGYYLFGVLYVRKPAVRELFSQGR